MRQANGTTLTWKSRYRDNEVVTPSALDIGLPAGTPMTYREGTLFKLTDGTYWIFANGVRRRFYHPSLYLGMGYSSVGALALSTSEASHIAQGPLIV
ncbi:MAG: hypothetical protein E6G68_07520 [Actinobacteria bacterium]|nr:MAG: hypothetical protein E6G68_07520 [Actinomycetota bacterium]